MIRRMKRQTKHRHSVQADGLRFRWKGEDGYWHTTHPRFRSATITMGSAIPVIGGPLTPDVFATDACITIERYG